MSTVSKAIADRIIAGEYDEDRIVKIVTYNNIFNNELSYGLIDETQPLDTYKASDFVINPQTYWEKPSCKQS